MHLYRRYSFIKFMSLDEQLEQLIEQTIQGATATIPAHLEEIEQNKKILKINDPKEFVYGLIMGIGLGMASALMTTITNKIPTVEDQIKVRDMIYKKIPHIREKGKEFLEIYDTFYKKFEWVRNQPWKEDEAPFIKIISTNKSSWGLK